MSKPIDTRGFTFYVCVGKYGGWRAQIDGPSLRVTLGWIGFCIMARDIEQQVGALMNEIKYWRELAQEIDDDLEVAQLKEKAAATEDSRSRPRLGNGAGAG